MEGVALSQPFVRIDRADPYCIITWRPPYRVSRVRPYRTEILVANRIVRQVSSLTVQQASRRHRRYLALLKQITQEQQYAARVFVIDALARGWLRYDRSRHQLIPHPLLQGMLETGLLDLPLEEALPTPSS